MNVKARAFGEPVSDHGGFMGARVVSHNVNFQPGRHLSVDHIQKLTELPRTVPAVKVYRSLDWFSTPAPQTAMSSHGAYSRGYHARPALAAEATMAASGPTPESDFSHPH